MAELEPFEGKPVVQVGVELPSAAGGLRKALAVDPKVWVQGEKVYLVFETTAHKVRHEPIDDGDPKGPQRRVHVLRVDGATSVDAEVVAEQLEAQQRRIEESKGLRNLYTDDDGLLGMAHARSEHADGLVEGCPVCKAEKDAQEAEAAKPVKGRPVKGRRARKAPGA